MCFVFAKAIIVYVIIVVIGIKSITIVDVTITRAEEGHKLSIRCCAVVKQLLFVFVISYVDVFVLVPAGFLIKKISLRLFVRKQKHHC